MKQVAESGIRILEKSGAAPPWTRRRIGDAASPHPVRTAHPHAHQPARLPSVHRHRPPSRSAKAATREGRGGDRLRRRGLVPLRERRLKVGQRCQVHALGPESDNYSFGGQRLLDWTQSFPFLFSTFPTRGQQRCDCDLSIVIFVSTCRVGSAQNIGRCTVAFRRKKNGLTGVLKVATR